MKQDSGNPAGATDQRPYQTLKGMTQTFQELSQGESHGQSQAGGDQGMVTHEEIKRK